MRNPEVYTSFGTSACITAHNHYWHNWHSKRFTPHYYKDEHKTITCVPLHAHKRYILCRVGIRKIWTRYETRPQSGRRDHFPLKLFFLLFLNKDWDFIHPRQFPYFYVATFPLNKKYYVGRNTGCAGSRNNEN